MYLFLYQHFSLSTFTHIPLHLSCMNFLSLHNHFVLNLHLFSHPFIPIFSILFIFFKHVSNMCIAVSTSSVSFDINLDLHNLFSHVMQSTGHEEKLPTLPVDVKEFVVWIHSCPILAWSYVVRVMFNKASKRKRQLKKYIFLRRFDAMSISIAHWTSLTGALRVFGSPCTCGTGHANGRIHYHGFLGQRHCSITTEMWSVSTSFLWNKL